MQIFAHSVNAMASGLTPEEDWLGESLGPMPYLAGGWQAILTRVRGDWELFSQCFRIPRWDGAACMCWLCAASSTIEGLLFTNCTRAAGWRATRRTHENFERELEAAGLVLPALFVYCIGFRLCCLAIDVLHCVDQGVASHVIGNVMWELVCSHAFGGSSQDANVELLAVEMDKFYKATKEKTRLQGKLTA